MPGSSAYAMQHEPVTTCVWGAALREPRRSEPAVRSAGAGGGAVAHTARAPRASVHVGAENLAPVVEGSVQGAGCRRSRWLGPSVGVRRTSPTGARAGAGALLDITNVAGGRVFTKAQKQPSVSQVPVVTTVARAGATATPMPTVAVPMDGDRGPTAAPVATPLSPAPAPARAKVAPAAPAPAAPLATEVGPVEEDADNIQRVPEYVPEIFSQLLHEEADFLPRPNYMDWQGDINGKMRAILVDWLIEVHMKYQLRPETLFLTVNIIDRYLSRMPVMRTRLQLVGVVAMFIAAKFEEIDPPKVTDFVYITDNAYTKEDILFMECTVLTALEFQISVPTVSHFFESLQRANRCDDLHREVAQYLLESALLDLRMIRHVPSHLVAAALLLSNELLGRHPVWPASMVHHSWHAEHSLRGCAEELRGLLEAAPSTSLQAVRKKYSLPQHRSVAKMAFVTA